MEAKRTRNASKPVRDKERTRMKRTAGIYLRISDDREGDALGVKRQEQDCKKKAKALGWSVGAVYRDNDISGWSGAHRPQWELMLDDLEAGRINAVIAYSSARMYRRTRELERLIDMAGTTNRKARRDIAIETIVSGEIDLTTADGRMVARIKADVDNAEADRVSERQQRKHKELAEAGKYKGGRRPYGYERDGVTIVPDERDIIREMAQRVINHEPAGRIARDLNARGIPTAEGKAWTSNRILTILRSPRIVGQRVHHGELTQAVWPAILKLNEYQAIQDMHAENSAAYPKRVRESESFPLTVLNLRHGDAEHGIPGCGTPVHGQTQTIRGQRRKVYVCSNGCMVVRADRLEAEVRYQASGREAPQTLKVTGPERDMAEHAEDAIAIEMDSKKLEQLRDAGDIDLVAYSAERKRIKARLDMLREKMAAAAELYRANSDDNLNLLIEGITILSAPKRNGSRFMPVEDRIKITWRKGSKKKPGELPPRDFNKPYDPRCSVEGCDRRVLARGWCGTHYQRWANTGDVKADMPIKAAVVPRKANE
jgi:DNA invertase Pin-like site-specific DNA recombinase